ncbi:Asp-tRNA(Asn)/Glu-tRNA(Gln) amidotransferase subunit GatA [Streptomyces sanglieri]
MQGDITDETVKGLANRLDIELSPEDRDGATDRINKLSDIYTDLASITTPSSGRSAGPETFVEPPSNPEPNDDPYNAWLKQFELVRPEASGALSDCSVAVKDNICLRGVELTVGSRAFEGVVPDEHATVVDQLLEAGATIMGKTNMDELAFGPTSETSAFGPTENPVKDGHVAGGSSSGSAAAVAANDVDLALGTDTGGSVRIPASYCGLVGMKPTYGAVPLHGVVPLSYSMDHVGTLARDVTTAAKGLEVIAGSDDVVDADSLGIDIEELTIATVSGFFEKHTSDKVAQAVNETIEELNDRGATVTSIELPTLEYSREAWWGLAPSEFAAEFESNAAGVWRDGDSLSTLVSNLGRVRQCSSRDLGQNIKEMLVLGAYLNHELDYKYYSQARTIRAQLTREFEAAFDDVDLIAAPGTPTRALEIDGFERGVTPPVNWVTHPTNLTGHPSVVLPCDEIDGLPVSIQFMGKLGADQLVLDAASAYESMRGSVLS